MRRAVTLALFGALLLSTTSSAGAIDTESLPQLVRYGSDPRQTFDAYPNGRTGQPWVMVVHGGSWMGGDKADMVAAVEGLRRAGFVVFSVNYRLSPSHGWPAQRDDVRAAIRHIVTRPGEYGVDPHRGALYGLSAGGHIAASAALYGNLPVKAVVGVSSVLQPLSLWQYAMGKYRPAGYVEGSTDNLAGWAALLFRGPPIPAYPGLYGRWRDGTPQNYASRTAIPVLEVHSEGDRGVPIQQAANFVNALNSQRRGRATLIRVAGSTHDDSIVWGNTARRDAVVRFLRQHTA